jgi:hypothetical protein
MTNRFTLLLIASVPMVIVYAADCQAPTAQPIYVRVTLCQLAFHHEKVNPKYVSLDLEYVNADPHGQMLLNRHCPTKGLLIDFPNTGLDSNAATLRDQRWIIARATGTFRGMLERDQRTGRLVLSVQSVLKFRPAYMYSEHVPGPIRLPEPDWPKWPPN